MFNPFGKDFNALNEDDLKALCSISEGWYIEYKSILPDSKKIAKSIASFSNSYGGLYILGVEADKQNNCAIDFPGVNSKLDSIHDAVRGNLNPFPYFDCYTVGLKDGNYVIIVAVKEGIEPPCIHSDGRIYRRQESSSDPIPENNRYSLDQLYNKSQKYKERIEDFRTLDYGFCQGEKNWSYLIGYVNTRHLEKSILNDFSLSDFSSKIMNIFNEEFYINEDGFGQITGRCYFNNITLFPDSLIIRNISNIAYNTLTIELFKNGSMKFMLPINTIRLPDTSISERIEQYCENNRINDSDVIKWVSLSNFFTSIISIFIPYFKFLENYNYHEDLEIVFEGRNIWRICLFSEEEEYFDYIKKFSLPVILKDTIIYPEKAFKIGFAGEGERGKGYIAALATILGVASSGFGIPISTSLDLFFMEGRKKAKQL
jgi:hypothetical protein